MGGGGAPVASRKTRVQAWLMASTMAGMVAMAFLAASNREKEVALHKEGGCYPHRHSIEQRRGSEGDAHRVAWRSRFLRAPKFLERLAWTTAAWGTNGWGTAAWSTVTGVEARDVEHCGVVDRGVGDDIGWLPR